MSRDALSATFTTLAQEIYRVTFLFSLCILAVLAIGALAAAAGFIPQVVFWAVACGLLVLLALTLRVYLWAGEIV